jgi:hypothetical protein
MIPSLINYCGVTSGGVKGSVFCFWLDALMMMDEAVDAVMDVRVNMPAGSDRY